MMKTKILQRLLLLLLLTLGVETVWAQLSMPYYKEFESGSTDVFVGGDIASGTNITNVLRVTNSTSVASFATAHTLRSNEVVTLSFIAYHGYLGGSSTSSIAIFNSEGQELVGYTYNHNSGLITDVRIGGNTSSEFSEFSGASYINDTQRANGLTGGNSGKPYLTNNDYNPNISMSVSGNGTARLTFWRKNGDVANLWRDISGSLGSLKLDVKAIRITSNCDNEDRTICINYFYLRSSYYSNDFETGTNDWTTATSGRFTPVILEESGNHFLSVKQDERNNNGTTISSTSLGVPAGTSYHLSFDLRISCSNNQSPTIFRVRDAANTDDVFSLTATDKGVTTWKVNGKVNGGETITLDGTFQGTNDITSVPWYSITIVRAGTNTWVSIKNKSTNADILTYLPVAGSSTGGIGIMEFVTSRYNANFAIDNVVVTPMLDWSDITKTVDITEVGNTNPNKIESLPTITIKNYDVTSYASSDANVAIFPVSTTNTLLIKGVGTTTITATDTQGYTASYTLTVTGTSVTPTLNADQNTLTFDHIGLIANNTASGGVSHTLSTGLQIDYGHTGETAIVVDAGMGTVLKLIDTNGYSHPNLTGGVIPPVAAWGGTFVKLTATHSGYLTVTGNVSATDTKLYLSNGTMVSCDIDEEAHTLMATLTGGSVYYLYTVGSDSSPYTPLIHSINYADPLFVDGTAVIEIPDDGTYSIPAITGMTNPSFSLIRYGALSNVSLGISGNTVSGITAGGAFLVKAEEGGKTAYHLVTVAYKATDYPGQFWDFNEAGAYMTTSDVLKSAPLPTISVTDDNKNSWTARYKNVYNNRAPEWRLNRTVDNDNAVIVPETAGLLFNTGRQCFYLRNDDDVFKHIGIYNYGASFTIPFLKAGDIVELNWKHDASGSGSEFTATHLNDLRNKPVNESFLITESAERNKDHHVGRYSFIVAEDGDVTFTLKDNGYTDILSIRIYKGPYRSTMRDINLSGNGAAPTTMLLDNAQQGYTYNYCNQLYSTATGPAMYVLKGYRKNNGGTLGVDYDHEGCVTGSNAAKTPEFFTDEDAYPVSDEEKTRLYELRKNLVGFQMYNDTWQSSRNSYNNGVIKATSGWGKVTIRMNNYTNDMKYVIGYTPDFTLTIGSAPHQKYPYTWDFTKIAGQRVTGAADNVLYSIEAEGSDSDFSGTAPTNWFKNENGQYMLNTDNSGDLGSQYVPGAVLVTQDRALSNFNGVDYDAKWAKDELDGLGFDGGITMHTDHLPSNDASGWNRASVEDKWNSLLSFKITDHATFTKTGGTDEEPVGTWSYSQDLQEAGSGQAQLHHSGDENHIDESSIPSGGIGFRLDDGNSKYIYVIPSSPLQAGDVISVTAYNAFNFRDAGICFNRSASSADVAQSMMLSGRMVEETLDYTVVANDGLDGRNDFYLYKNANTVHISAIEISRKASTIPNLDWSIYTLTKTTVIVPDLNAESKQDWIYVSASAEPESVTNATKVTEGTDGPDAITGVYKYKVTDPGNSDISFAAGTKIYKIGVTHILKEIHPVGGTGWATEIRNQNIDHELIGYFTKNDVNAYTVQYDSYDLNTATVALTPINEDGYVTAKTGIVMKLDNAIGLSDANAGKYVPLFYPSYTRPVSSTPMDFPANNLMYNVDAGIDNNNQNYNEQLFNFNESGVDYTKFILTNIHWTYDINHTLNTDESAAYKEEDAAGFYRLHIWKTLSDEENAAKNTMPAHNAFLLVPTDYLPLAVWSQQSIASARQNTIGIRTAWGEEVTAIDEVEVSPDIVTGEENTAEGDVWYTLSGMKLPKRPTKSGLYICNGKKVAVHDSCP